MVLNPQSIEIKLDHLDEKITGVNSKVQIIDTKLDEYLILQAVHNNNFYECKGKGRVLNKIVFIILGTLLAGQLIGSYFIYKETKLNSSGNPSAISFLYDR